MEVFTKKYLLSSVHTKVQYVLKKYLLEQNLGHSIDIRHFSIYTLPTKTLSGCRWYRNHEKRYWKNEKSGRFLGLFRSWRKSNTTHHTSRLRRFVWQATDFCYPESKKNETNANIILEKT